VHPPRGDDRVLDEPDEPGHGQEREDVRARRSTDDHRAEPARPLRNRGRFAVRVLDELRRQHRREGAPRRGSRVRARVGREPQHPDVHRRRQRERVLGEPGERHDFQGRQVSERGRRPGGGFALSWIDPAVFSTGRRVKGTLFVDYVRMLRSRSDLDWSRRLEAVDLGYLVQRIDPEGWYPMETFERMGLAILDEIAQGDLVTVRMFGRGSIDWLCQKYENLVAEGDARDTLMRFQVLRRGFFDYSALEIGSISDGEAS